VAERFVGDEFLPDARGREADPKQFAGLRGTSDDRFRKETEHIRRRIRALSDSAKK
jgi:hypothetical protein